LLLSLLHDHLQAVQPGSKGLRDVRPKDWIAVIGIGRSVQNRTTARNWGPVIDEIRNKLLELFDAIRFFIHMQESRVPGGLPCIVERLGGKFFLTREVTVVPQRGDPVAKLPRRGGDPRSKICLMELVSVESARKRSARYSIATPRPINPAEGMTRTMHWPGPVDPR
jgi:hypothetical protein